MLTSYKLTICYSTGILSNVDNMSKILYPIREIKVDNADAQELLRIYEGHSTFGFYQLVFSSIESSMRSIVAKVPVTSIKGERCKQHAGFDDLYTGIIEYTGISREYIDLFKFLNLIRNTVHNRSVYNSREGSQVVIYKGKTYNFMQGEHIDFARIELIFDLLLDVKCFFEDVFASRPIVNEQYIRDICL